tara:strand:+ start:2055 stop:2921 length:867 start_codon:yes stop_codon:yes gene_type:complete
MTTKMLGDPEGFDKNWKSRKETFYNHHVTGVVKNQIQLAFRSHFEVFSQILKDNPTKGKKLIETGCGRGTLSNYFALDGWDVTLLDYNESVIDVAKKIFSTQNIDVNYKVGDALDLPYEDESFDVITNIGLLEHFDDSALQKLLDEQTRVLSKDGWCFSYVVPENPRNIQRYFNWINALLKIISFSWLKKNNATKPEIFRSDHGSERYLKCLENSKVKNITSFGMYPMPMISHDADFPFSLLPGPIEFCLASFYKLILFSRKLITGKHGWICSEKLGQAFLIAYQKDE